jgi:hypothetical protein
MNAIPLTFLLLFATAQQSSPLQSEPTQQQRPEPAHETSEQMRPVAIHLNELAGNIHSEEDAKAFVDAIAERFGGGQLQTWTTRGTRHRVAHAEFEAVSDPSKLITEQRIVEIWNEYVRELEAPAETLVNVAEIHNLRDATFTMSQMMWQREGMQQFWTAPGIYAVGPDGKIASGCRAIEALKIFHDLSFSFQNIQSARERVQKGILVSDRSKKHEQNPAVRPSTVQASMSASTKVNPIMPAENRYLHAHGEGDYRRLLEKLFAELFPED